MTSFVVGDWALKFEKAAAQVRVIKQMKCFDFNDKCFDWIDNCPYKIGEKS
jgi:hypothetical protein